MSYFYLFSVQRLGLTLEYRRQLSSWYKEGLKDLIANGKIKIISFEDKCITSNHVFQIVIENRNEILTKLNENSIFPGVHYMLNTAYAPYDEYIDACPKAHYYEDRILSLPVHIHMKKENVEYVCKTLVDLLK